MAFLTGFAIYFVIWWVTLFLVLPHGNRSQAEAEERALGTDPGAPVNARFGLKLAINTLLAGVVFGIYWLASSYFGLSFSNLPSPFPDHLK